MPLLSSLDPSHLAYPSKHSQSHPYCLPQQSIHYHTILTSTVIYTSHYYPHSKHPLPQYTPLCKRSIMHRTYSMRQSRAPTASQIQNPPPPSSTTKSGRFFGKAGLGEFSGFFLLDFVREPTDTFGLVVFKPREQSPTPGSLARC